MKQDFILLWIVHNMGPLDYDTVRGLVVAARSYPEALAFSTQRIKETQPDAAISIECIGEAFPNYLAHEDKIPFTVLEDFAAG